MQREIAEEIFFSYCYVFTFLKMFIDEFVIYKSSKNKCVYEFQLNTLLFSPLLCPCLHSTDITIVIAITVCSAQLFVLLAKAIVLLEFHTQLVTRLN